MKYNELTHSSQEKAYDYIYYNKQYKVQYEIGVKTREYAYSLGISYLDGHIPWDKHEAEFDFLETDVLRDIYENVFTENDQEYFSFLEEYAENDWENDFEDTYMVNIKADDILQCDYFEMYRAEAEDISPLVEKFYPHLLEKYRVRNLFHPIVKKEKHPLSGGTYIFSSDDEKIERFQYIYDEMFLRDLEKEMEKTKDYLWNKVNAVLQERHRTILEYGDEIETEIMDKWFNQLEFNEDGSIQ